VCVRPSPRKSLSYGWLTASSTPHSEPWYPSY
jgi:hypothetical protein